MDRPGVVVTLVERDVQGGRLFPYVQAFAVVDELEAGEVVGLAGLRGEFHRVVHAPVGGVGRIDHEEVEDAVGHRQRLAGE